MSYAVQELFVKTFDRSNAIDLLRIFRVCIWIIILNFKNLQTYVYFL